MAIWDDLQKERDRRDKLRAKKAELKLKKVQRKIDRQERAELREQRKENKKAGIERADIRKALQDSEQINKQAIEKLDKIKPENKIDRRRVINEAIEKHMDKADVEQEYVTLSRLFSLDSALVDYSIRESETKKDKSEKERISDFLPPEISDIFEKVANGKKLISLIGPKAIAFATNPLTLSILATLAIAAGGIYLSNKANEAMKEWFDEQETRTNNILTAINGIKTKEQGVSAAGNLAYTQHKMDYESISSSMAYNLNMGEYGVSKDTALDIKSGLEKLNSVSGEQIDQKIREAIKERYSGNVTFELPKFNPNKPVESIVKFVSAAAYIGALEGKRNKLYEYSKDPGKYIEDFKKIILDTVLDPAEGRLNTGRWQNYNQFVIEYNAEITKLVAKKQAKLGTYVKNAQDVLDSYKELKNKSPYFLRSQEELYNEYVYTLKERSIQFKSNDKFYTELNEFSKMVYASGVSLSSDSIEMVVDSAIAQTNIQEYKDDIFKNNNNNISAAVDLGNVLIAEAAGASAFKRDGERFSSEVVMEALKSEGLIEANGTIDMKKFERVIDSDYTLEKMEKRTGFTKDAWKKFYKELSKSQAIKNLDRIVDEGLINFKGEDLGKAIYERELKDSDFAVNVQKDDNTQFIRDFVKLRNSDDDPTNDVSYEGILKEMQKGETNTQRLLDTIRAELGNAGIGNMQNIADLTAARVLEIIGGSYQNNVDGGASSPVSQTI